MTTTANELSYRIEQKRNINGALRCDFKYEGQTAKTEQDPVSHLRHPNENESDT